MSRPIEGQLSDEDYQLIEANHLGNPLSVYRLRIISIRIMRGLGLLLLVVGYVPPAIMIMIVFLGLYKEQIDGVFYMPIDALFILCIEIPRIKKQHLIVCEQGLVEVRKRGWSKNVKALHWQDILTVRKFMNGYSITSQQSKVFDLDNTYQNIDTLVEVIRQRSGIV